MSGALGRPVLAKLVQARSIVVGSARLAGSSPSSMDEGELPVNSSATGSIRVAAEDSQWEVGARVGGTHQRVNSVIKAWQKRGLIESHKDGTRILDIQRLSAEARRSGFDVDHYLAGWHGGRPGRQ